MPAQSAGGGKGGLLLIGAAIVIGIVALASRAKAETTPVGPITPGPIPIPPTPPTPPTPPPSGGPTMSRTVASQKYLLAQNSVDPLGVNLTGVELQSGGHQDLANKCFVAFKTYNDGQRLLAQNDVDGALQKATALAGQGFPGLSSSLGAQVAGAIPKPSVF